MYLIGVHCELDRRERNRGERRPHVVTAGIHTFDPCDLEVNTTTGLTADLGEAVIEARRSRPVHPAPEHKPRTADLDALVASGAQPAA